MKSPPHADFHCTSHCVCFTFDLPGEKWKRISVKAEARYNTIKKKILASEKISENRLSFGAHDKNFRIEFNPSKSSHGQIHRVLTAMAGVLELKLIREAKRTEIDSCTTFHYGAHKFNVIPELGLPVTFPLIKGVGNNKLGNAELIGVNLRFNDSAIGLRLLKLDVYHDDYIRAEVHTIYSVESLENILNRCYENNLSISSLFVVEK